MVLESFFRRKTMFAQLKSLKFTNIGLYVHSIAKFGKKR